MLTPIKKYTYSKSKFKEIVFPSPSFSPTFQNYKITDIIQKPSSNLEGIQL